MLRNTLFALFAVVVIGGGYWSFSSSHSNVSTGHDQHSGQPAHPSAPLEVGQAGFAAIAEIVVLLQADTQTDWSSVNITKLRDHLLDMQALTTGARVTQTETPNGLLIEVTGDEMAKKAAQTMVPAHASVLNGTSDWKASTELTLTGVTLEISAQGANEQQKLRALGFFGIMATGAHHQPHHLAIATGRNIHAH